MPAACFRPFATLLACVACTTIALADEAHYDVFVTGSAGRLVIGGYDDAATTAIVPADQLRVFGGEVVPSGTSGPYESASPGEPGFRAATQSFLNNAALTTPAGVFSALPAATPLTFSFLPISIGADTRNLFYWSGTGAVAFAPAAADVALDLTKQGGGGWTAGITGASAGVIPGNTIQVTSSGGSAGAVHTHLFASIGKAGSAPDQGFYLYSLGLQMSGMTDADPLYFVFGAVDPAALTPQEFADFETAHGSAELWVENNLAAVPEPAALPLMAGLAAAAAVGWRRGGTFARRRNQTR
jgi:NOL1/NOP2/fmu family ribosome biogenesis protein